MARAIFINYRRSLNLVEAQLLRKVLERHFGKGRVFLDVSGLDGGEHWLHTLERQVDASAAMVSLIGPGWLEVKDETGARRLDNPNDFVRFEIARAFSRKMPVVPLRLDGADMPSTAELPLNLQELAFQQAMLLRRDSFDDDGDKIARRLKVLIADARRRGVPRWAVVAISVTALLAGVAAGPTALTRIGLMKPATDADLRSALERMKAELDAALKARSQAETDLQAARDRLAAEQRARAAAESDVKALSAKLGDAQTAREAAEVRLAEASAKVKALEKQLDDMGAALNAANARADKAEAALKSAQAAPGQAPQTTAPGQLDATRAPKPLTAAELAALKPKDGFKECADCPEMVVVPAGTFLMGSSDGKTKVIGLDGLPMTGNPPPAEAGHDKSESPVHEVAISKPFAVGRFSVTFAEWDACAADGGCGGYKPKDEGWGRGTRPVINVNWDDAKSYVTWLSKKTGRIYRLLTEAEREYVTRAGTKTPFWWGSSISTEQANYNGTSTYGGGPTGEYRQKTLPVKSFAPNPWGLYQVHGNVWEWVEDCWEDSYTGVSNDGSAWTTGNCSQRVLRGGSWSGSPQNLRAASRSRYSTSNRCGIVGFRVARTLNPAP